MYPVEGGGGGVGEGGRSGKVDVVPADWRKPRLPSQQRQPMDSAEVPPLEFSEVPWRGSREKQQ